VLLLEVEGRQGIAQLFDVPPLPYEERRVAGGPRGRRGLRPGRRPRGGAARVPRDVLQPAVAPGRRCAGWGPSTSRRRSRPACATCCSPARPTRPSVASAGRPTSTTRSSWTPRRPAGSPASSTSTRGRRAGQGGPDPPSRPTRSWRHPLARTAVHLVTLLEEMPVQETATASRAARPNLPGRRRRRQPGARPGAPADAELAARAAGSTLRPADLVARPGLTRADLAAARRRGATGRGRSLAEAATTPSGSRSRAAARRRPRRRSAAHLRAAADARRHRPRRALRAGRGAARAGDGMTGRPRHHDPLAQAAARGGARLDVDALLDDPSTRIIVCCGPAGSARPRPPPRSGCGPPSAAAARRRAHHRPGRGWPSRWGCPSSTTTRAGRRGGHGQGARRDDAGHEADLRRGRRGHADPGPARRSWPTPSTRRCRARSPARRSTWRWRSSASCAARRGDRHLGPHRRRHPAVALRAGLPRRARSGSGPSSTAGSSGSSPRRPAAGGKGLPGWSPRASGVHQRADQDHRRPGAADVQTFVAALDTMFGGFRERAEQTYALLQAPGPRSSWWPRPSATPCARRRTSSSGSRPTTCRWPAWCSTGCRRCCASTPTGSRRCSASDGWRTGSPRRTEGWRWRWSRPSRGRRRPRRAARGRRPPHGHARLGRAARNGADAGDGAAAAQVDGWWSYSSRAVSSRRRQEVTVGGGAAGHGARARSCRPTPRTRCGCRGRRPGTRCARAGQADRPWRGSGRHPGRTARPGRCCGRRPRWSSPRSRSCWVTLLCSPERSAARSRLRTTPGVDPSNSPIVHRGGAPRLLPTYDHQDRRDRLAMTIWHSHL
jgi:hypothetical protein